MKRTGIPHPILIPLLSLLLVGLSAHAKDVDLNIEFGERTWTSADGRELQAQLVSTADGQAQLKLTTTGKTVPVPLANLSEEDRKYIGNWVEAKKLIWNFEVLKVDYPSSFRTKPRGEEATRQTIKPMMGEPDDILLLLTLKVTPPPDVAAFYFDAAGMIFKVQTPDATIVTAAPKYIVPPDDKEKAAEDGSVERSILYQVPKGAKPAEITYRDNPVITL